MMKRRQFIKLGAGGGFALMVPGGKLLSRTMLAPFLPPLLHNPLEEELFVNAVPNALTPGFIFQPSGRGKKRRIQVGVHPFTHDMGFKNGYLTQMFGYGEERSKATYPGKTFEISSGTQLTVNWQNNLGRAKGHLLPVDTSLHWAYSLLGYTQYNISKNGVPIVPHVHGGHTEAESDGNPEYFFSPDYGITGPRWVKRDYSYDNDQPAGTIWYHDHALGITRLNVYAGMAGFYIIRDNQDTGMWNNSLNLPAYPYEAAFAIQDKMFTDTGELFYPAFPEEPFYDDFITGEGAILPPALFPGGGPTALAEFFGDHMIVNGKLWPKMDVEPRNYRLRFLNGCDSRFLVVEFHAVGLLDTEIPETSTPLPFTVIGGDQGLASAPRQVTTLVMETGSRYDIIFNFDGLTNQRIIMKNLASDSPFGFDYGPDVDPNDLFPDRRTDRIMAFDVKVPLGSLDPKQSPTSWNAGAVNWPASDIPTSVDRVRKVGLFEGKDEFGRLQPILGTAEPATDFAGNPINWPNMEPYISAGLIGQMQGAIAWHSPTTENPALNSVERWELYNVTGDSHPIHLHLVHFDVVERREIKWDANTIGPNDPSGEEEDRVIPNALYATPAGNGTYLELQPVIQHNSTIDPLTWGNAFRIVNPTEGPVVTTPPEYFEDAPKDMVTARPGEITKIRAKFDRPGRYVWHCHILSHEDHEMMRALHVGPESVGTPNVATAGITKVAQADTYPNPFRELVNFKIELTEAAQMELRVFDEAGRQLRSIGRGEYDAGTHTLSWDGTGVIGASLTAGLYVYHVLVDGQIARAGKISKI